MNQDNYELMPLNEIKRLKEEISELKQEKHYAPSFVVAKSLDRLANSLEGLFKIFEVAATDIEQDNTSKKSFEEHIMPIIDKLERLESQNKDIAEGMLALADIVKRLDENNSRESVVPYGMDEKPSMPPPMDAQEGMLPPMPQQGMPSPKPAGLPPISPGDMPPPMPK
ncbi:hypothetical protein KY321_02485 [Candidatus Woesearchaeota archaeon]|nr:hypothetical protein [Candidatus Woesearchaeota archaeon]